MLCSHFFFFYADERHGVGLLNSPPSVFNQSHHTSSYNGVQGYVVAKKFVSCRRL